LLPGPHQPLRVDADVLIADEAHRYRIDVNGTPLFAKSGLAPEVERQRQHD